MGGLLGGAKGYVGPTSQIIRGPAPPGPPSSYAYEIADQENKRNLCVRVICLDIISVYDKYPDEDAVKRQF